MSRNCLLAQLSKGFKEQSFDSQIIQIGIFTRIVCCIFFNTQFHFIQKQFLYRLTAALSGLSHELARNTRKIKIS